MFFFVSVDTFSCQTSAPVFTNYHTSVENVAQVLSEGERGGGQNVDFSKTFKNVQKNLKVTVFEQH